MEDQSSPQQGGIVVDYSIHRAIKDKPVAWRAEYGSNWESHSSSLEALRDHVSSGGAFIPASMSSSHRTSGAFRHADLAVVDVDHGLSIAEFRNHPLASEASWV